jgi:hypothetical protein
MIFLRCHKPILSDPTTGRYIQADPLGLVDGPSVYNYALQNPGRYVDPRGEQACYTDIKTGEEKCYGLSDTYCPSGRCASEPATSNVREDWPEYEQCIQTCLDSEPLTNPSSWLPLSESTRAQCAIVSFATAKTFRLPRGTAGLVTQGCRRDICEQRCLTTCEE